MYMLIKEVAMNGSECRPIVTMEAWIVLPLWRFEREALALRREGKVNLVMVVVRGERGVLEYNSRAWECFPC